MPTAPTAASNERPMPPQPLIQPCDSPSSSPPPPQRRARRPLALCCHCVLFSLTTTTPNAHDPLTASNQRSTPPLPALPLQHRPIPPLVPPRRRAQRPLAFWRRCGCFFDHPQQHLSPPTPDRVARAPYTPVAQSSTLSPSTITSPITMTTRATPSGAAAVFFALCTIHTHRQHARRPTALNSDPTPLLLNRALEPHFLSPPPPPQRRAQCTLALRRLGQAMSIGIVRYHPNRKGA
ncbi:hypothetical protein DL93DRAFT_501482 [Clavulina sp. PMI_390]|nr:hypothetical protein DL93DRAFT_501482 [Clavulina sp. PMI_390]